MEDESREMIREEKKKDGNNIPLASVNCVFVVLLYYTEIKVG